MEMVRSALLLVAQTLGMFFPFWPVILVAALFGPRRIRVMLIMWVVFLLCKVFAQLYSFAPLYRLLPEPLSTYLFGILGIALICLAVVFAREQQL